MKNKLIIISSSVVLFGALFLASEAGIAYAQDTSGTSSEHMPSPTAQGYAMPMIPGVVGPNHGTTTSKEGGYPTIPLPISMASTQPSLTINGQGQAQLNNGQVQSINGSTITVSVFGINFTVDITNAKVSAGVALPDISSYLLNPSSTVPNNQPVTQTTINSGDKVSLNGTINSTTGVISAVTVRDLTAQSQSSTTVQNRINQLLQLINQLKAQYNL